MTKVGMTITKPSELASSAKDPYLNIVTEQAKTLHIPFNIIPPSRTNRVTHAERSGTRNFCNFLECVGVCHDFSAGFFSDTSSCTK